MKKALIIILAAVFGCTVLRAQDVPDGYVWADSLVFTPINDMDSTLVGKSIFSVLPDNVQIDQSGAVRSLMTRKSEGKGINGFRIRIFFDNSRTDGKMLLHYERGWDMEPETELGCRAYAILTKMYN